MFSITEPFDLCAFIYWKHFSGTLDFYLKKIFCFRTHSESEALQLKIIKNWLQNEKISNWEKVKNRKSYQQVNNGCINEQNQEYFERIARELFSLSGISGKPSQGNQDFLQNHVNYCDNEPSNKALKHTPNIDQISLPANDLDFTTIYNKFWR
jgi:formylmethanofuran dehydrogenase subunit E